VYFTTSNLTEATRVYSGNATVADMDKILSDEDVGANWWTSSEGGTLDDAKTWASGIDDDPIDNLADEIRDYDEAYIGMQLAITARLPAEFRHESSGDTWEHRVPNTDKLVIDAIDYSVDNGNTWHTVKVNGKIARKVTSGLGGRPDERDIRASAEELACHDASCAPPPVGTGGSSKAGGDVSTILRRGTTAERIAFAESLFNHELPHECSSHIKSDSFEDGILANPNNNVVELFMEGKIVDKNGEHIGHFERHIEVERDGSLTAHHDTLVIDPAWHGVGLAQSFTSQSVDQYSKIGVEKIEVLAAMEVGAFAWARQGYQFEPKHEAIRKQWVEDRLLWVKKVADEGTKDRWSVEDAQQMKKAAQDLINASNRGEPVQPIHIASLGEDRFRWNATGYTRTAEGPHEFQYETWPGKEVLVNWNQGNPERGDPSWSGIKYLNDRGDSVAAGAVEIEEFYSPTQARDKEGKWTLGARQRPADIPGPPSGIQPGVGHVQISGYNGEMMTNAEGYKFHGPRHIADDMDPELRKRTTDDLLTRNFRGGGSDLPGHLEDYIRDSGFNNGGSIPIGLAFQVAHLYEATSWPEKVGLTYAQVDKVRNLIADYDDNVMRNTLIHKHEDVVKLHDAIYEITGVDATTGLIGAINRSWQVSASDTISVAAHLTVAKTHDVSEGREVLGDYMQGDRLAKADAALADIGEANMKAVTDATYATTQRELNRLFPDKTLTIHRGVADDASFTDLGTTAWVKPSPLSSWSTDSATASDFAGDDGWTMRIQHVPHENIYSLATITGMGSLDEREVILIGHEQKAEVFGPDDYD
jgi:hypothetical protein